MPRISTTPRALFLTLSCALASLFALAGCVVTPTGAPTQAQATATLIPIPPTPTTMVVTLRTQSVGGAQVAQVIPGPHGLLLIPPAKGPDNPQPASGEFFPTSISFYNLTTNQLTHVANAPTAADGSQGVILNAAYAGDWITYETANASQANVALWIYNVVTSQRSQIAAAGMSTGAPWQFWVANATDVVWVSFTGNSDGGGSSTLLDYTYATGQTRTLYTTSAAVIKPAAMNATTVLFFEDKQSDPNGTTWLQQLNQSTPVKISDEAGVGASMNAQYAAWGDPHTNGTYLYDLSANALKPNFANCLRPALDDIGPYMLCYNFSGAGDLLIHLPDGAQITYQAGSAGQIDGLFSNGRGYTVAADGSVQYFNLPTQ